MTIKSMPNNKNFLNNFDRTFKVDKKSRFFTAIKGENGEWENTDKRGYGQFEFACYNAEQMSRRNGGMEVAIFQTGEIKTIYFRGADYGSNGIPNNERDLLVSSQGQESRETDS